MISSTIIASIFESVNFNPSVNFNNILKDRKVLTFPHLFNVCFELAYDPCVIEVKSEAIHLIQTLLESRLCFKMFYPLFNIKHGRKSVNDRWKVKESDKIIQKLLIKKDGLYYFLVDIFDILSSKNLQLSHALAQFLYSKPEEIDVNDYYNNISKQVVDLLNLTSLENINLYKNTKKELREEYLKFGHSVGVECVHRYILVDREKADKIILRELLKEIYEIFDENFHQNNKDMLIVIDSDRMLFLLRLILSLLNTFKTTFYFQELMISFSRLFLNVLELDLGNDNAFKTVCMEIMGRLIEYRHELNQDPVSLILDFCEMDPLRHLNEWVYARKNLDGESIEVAQYCDELQKNEQGASQSRHIIQSPHILSLAQVVCKLSNKDTRHAILVPLVTRLFKDKFSVDLPSQSNNSMLTSSTNEEEILKKSMVRNSLFIHLFNEVEPDSFKYFAKDLLDISVSILEWFASDAAKSNEARFDHLLTSLQMIGWVFEFTVVMVTENGETLSRLYGLLQEIMLNKSELPTQVFSGDADEENEIGMSHRDEVMMLCTNLCVVIATKGYVNPLKEAEGWSWNQASSKNVEEIERIDESGVVESSRVNQIFEDLDDVEPAVKMHGLVEMLRVVECGEVESEETYRKMMRICAHLMYHEDEVLYVLAVRCLAALGVRFPRRILPGLCIRLENLNSHQMKSQGHILCEAVTRLVRQLPNQIVHTYRHQILSVLLNWLHVCREMEEDESFCASCVSVLSEVCGVLVDESCHGLSDWMYRVSDVVLSLLKSPTRSPVCGDDSVQVACAIWIRRVLLGHTLDTRVVSTFQGRASTVTQVPADILSQMKRDIGVLLDRNLNAVLRDHLEVAYKALQDCVLAFLTPEIPANPWKKEMKILEFLHQ